RRAGASGARSRPALSSGATLPAGGRPATGAFAAELVFRICTSGFYGAITQAFASVRPVWAATLTTLVLLPALSHSLEFLLHYVRGTPELLRSVAISMTFTGLSTAFNLFAMRRGALVVGAGRPPLLHHLHRTPHLTLNF